MTRVNVVPVDVLSNQHLMAEYREITRLFTAVKKLDDVPVDIPKQYVLGTGHCKFFYDKIGYILKRYTALCGELLARDYDLNLELFNAICDDAELIDQKFMGDYTPDHNAIYLNMARLSKRSNMSHVHNELAL